jgi:hypothetical protein
VLNDFVDLNITDHKLTGEKYKGVNTPKFVAFCLQCPVSVQRTASWRAYAAIAAAWQRGERSERKAHGMKTLSSPCSNSVWRRGDDGSFGSHGSFIFKHYQLYVNVIMLSILYAPVHI